MNDSVGLGRQESEGEGPARPTGNGSLPILEQATVSHATESSAGLDRAEAFRHLVGDELDRAYRRATLMLGNQFEAEDAVHDAAERAWRSWSSLRDPRQFEAWFGRILVNVCRDRLRHRRRVTAIEDVSESAPEPTDQSAHRHVDGAGDRAVLLDALAALSPDERATIVLQFDTDLTVPEIARLTRTREGTVKSRLHHALRKLRAELGERWGDR